MMYMEWYAIAACIHAGTKNVAREMKKVAVGKVSMMGKTWFSELSDKSELNIMFDACTRHFIFNH